MSEGLSKYAKILEREGKEFRRTMEAGVSTLFSLNLAVNTEFWLGWILTPSVR